MKKLAEFKEPILDYDVELLSIPADELEVIPIQRKPSEPHIKRLTTSIKRIGFVVPLVVVRKMAQGTMAQQALKDKFIIIDGQHRFLAAKKAGVKIFPCIILPEKYINNLMELNVEKQMSLREKAYVSLNVYKTYMAEDSNINEQDIRILDSIESSHYVTIGICYERTQRFFGSAYESILKKVDIFIDQSLVSAFKERTRRADVLLELNELAQGVVEKIKRLGISHPFLHKEIISFCNPVKRKRKINENFDSLFLQLKTNLERLYNNPSEFRRHKFSAELE